MGSAFLLIILPQLSVLIGNSAPGRVSRLTTMTFAEDISKSLFTAHIARLNSPSLLISIVRLTERENEQPVKDVVYH